MATLATKELSLLAEIYRFLAASIDYPQPESFNKTYLEGLSGLVKELANPDDLQYLQESADDPGFLEAIQVEHTRLFINGVPRAAAPPYGSVYRHGEGMLMGRSTEKVRDFYRQYGFDLASNQHIPDHIVPELEFLALLAASGDGRGEELFLRQHFRPWFVVFKQRVDDNAVLPFYRIVVGLIDFFTKEDEEERDGSYETEISAVGLCGRSFGAVVKNCGGGE